MNTATRTGIELQSPNSNVSLRTTEILNESSPLEESRLADSTVPEGGYGWVVLFSCGVITFWFVGTTYCWGVIQGALVKGGLSTPATLSFVGSLTTACLSILALVSSKALRTLGARITGLLGIVCLSTGEILSGFTANNVGGLFVTTGIIMGIGVSLSFITVSILPAQYFSRKRGLANGIVFASGGFGGAIISFIMDGLLQRLGPSWTFRVIGFLTLITGLPSAWLIKERSPAQNRALVDWSLFKDPKFVILFLGSGVGIFPLVVPPFFLPLYAASLGLSATTGAGLVAAFNFSSALGRIACGLFSDVLGPLNTLFLSLLLTAVSLLALWPISSSLAPLIVFTVVNGASNGGFFATIPTVVGNVFGSARVSLVMGMIVTGWGGGYLMGAPIAGYLLNAYGGQSKGFEAYRPAIYYAGSMALSAAMMVAAARLRVDGKILKKA